MPNIHLRHTRTFLLVAFLLGSVWSCQLGRIKPGTYRIATVDNNVCKKLYGEVVVYAVFVDTKYTAPWSEYDIRSTLDSINKGMRWIEGVARQSGIPLTIKVVTHSNEGMVPVSNDFQNKTLHGTLFPAAMGVRKIDTWADKAAKLSAKSLPPDTAKIIKTKNKLSDRERLIARLRDIYKTDNVALMYFINNYYKDEISVTLHAGSMTDIEYAVVSFKKPAIIVHEFLHIFGALDLYYGPFDKRRSVRSRTAFVEREFPNEVMAFAHRNLDSLMISPFTRYLVGWEAVMDEHYRKLLLGKKIRTVRN